MRTWSSVLTVLIGLTVGSAVRAEEEQVPLDKLPARVAAAVKEKFPGAKLLSAEKETEDGKTEYELELSLKGQAIEVTVTEDGKIVEVEKEITAADLPKEVKAAIDSRYPDAVIKKAEEVTEEGKTEYEVRLVSGKKTLEITLHPSGKVLKTEDKTGDKDDDDRPQPPNARGR